MLPLTEVLVALIIETVLFVQLISACLARLLELPHVHFVLITLSAFASYLNDF